MISGFPEIEDGFDHATFVCRPEDRYAFLDYWFSRGFRLHGVWRTTRYPADHIALVRGEKAKFPWNSMIGLTVCEDLTKNRPLAKALEWNLSPTHHLQHLAFRVKDGANMETLREKLIQKGLPMMTPVLSYQDEEKGSSLHQFFSRANGFFFYEFAQRTIGSDGRPFSTFVDNIIDDLYEALDESLLWLPPKASFSFPKSLQLDSVQDLGSEGALAPARHQAG